MPVTPYSISGIVYDVDGSTKMTSGTVRVIDVTLGEYVEGDIASDGSFSVDLQNLTSDYSDGDLLQVVAYDTDKVKSTEFRHTVDINPSGYEKGSIYMHWTKPVLGEAKLFALILSNKNDTAEYTVDLYDRTNDHKILSLDVGPNTSLAPNLGFQGIKFGGGICVIRESDAANTVEVQCIVK